MQTGRHYSRGEAAVAAPSNYRGQHREFGTTEAAIGFIPLGDRTRDVPEFGVTYVEERDSIDIATSRRR